MRHVDYIPTSLVVDVTWAEKVKAVNQVLASERDPKKRAKIILKNSSLWGDVKYELSKVFNYKCWYTESPQVGTDVDVDHYRPKGRIAELSNEQPAHLGYWWLAFDLRNYRYSCIVANRKRRDVLSGRIGGKADHFPIIDEQKRVWDPSGDIEEEQPMLLDPCKITDVCLLTFKEDGEAMPRKSEDEYPRQFKRADLSIKYYNINHSDFVRARVQLRDEIKKHVTQAKRFYNKIETGDATNDYAYSEAIQALRKYIDNRSPFSSFCLAYLERFKHDDSLAGVFI